MTLLLFAAPKRRPLTHARRVPTTNDSTGRTRVPAALFRFTSLVGSPPPRLRSKWRKLARSKAENGEPEAQVRVHLKRGPSERFWLDYVMDAYAGERGGSVLLAGVPDRPDLLPHSKSYAGPQEPVAPMARLHERLQEVAAKEGMLQRAADELDATFAEMRLTKTPLNANELQLFVAYSTLAARSGAGETALDRVAREFAGTPELHAAWENLKRGGFAVMRVDRIHLDAGLDVFEARSRKKLFIHERSGTRQLAQGDVLLGWLCADASGTLTLEGHVTRIPPWLAGPAVDLVETLGETPKARSRRDFTSPPGLLPIRLLLGLRAFCEAAAVELANTSGHRLQFATGRFVVQDRALVLERLARAFEQVDEGTFHWVDEADTVLARIECTGDKVLVQVNSLERLEAAKRHVEEVLGDAAKPSLDSIDENVTETLRTHETRPEPPMELPPEVAAEVRAAVVERIRAMLDSPIPQFRGKSLRQTAKSKKSRPDAVSWLREQERILRQNPQLAGIDLRPIWSELELDYQGLDTDPRP